MKDVSTQHEELQELLISLTDGEIDGGRFDRLQSILSQDAEAQAYFRRYMRLCALLEFDRAESEQSIGRDDEGQISLGDQETVASFPSLSPLPSPVSPPFVGGPVFSYMVATVVLCAMLLSAWAYKITRSDSRFVNNPKPSATHRDQVEFVGRITGMADCKWSNPDSRPYAGSYVPLGRKYELTSGLLEITYTSGAKVILEGPCSYTVDSGAGGYLQQGKLIARVEKNDEYGMMNDEPKARNSDIHHSSFRNHHLFAVHTPTAVVTDLGTEFGVEVDEAGNTTSHVFRGSVEVQIFPSHNGRGAGGAGSVVLLENESVRAEKDGRVRETHHAPGEKIEPVRFTHPTAPPKFVRRIRELPKSLDLLDIVAGGNGLTARRERGIDPAVGLSDPIFLAVIREGNRQYNPITWHRFIDGVFIPDGRNETMRIDSADHTFDGFPTTSGNGYGSIWSRGAELQPKWRDTEKAPWFHAMGRAGQFMPESRGLLCFCPNAGITFDLEAVRRAYPDAVPSRFRAVAGLVDSRHLVPTADGMADLWIFVDGHLNLKREKLRPESGTVVVEIDLGPSDRFLTLASTDGGNGYENDYVVFGDPVLKLGPAEEDK